MKYGLFFEVDCEVLFLEVDDFLMIWFNGSLEIVGCLVVVLLEVVGMVFVGYLVCL